MTKTISLALSKRLEEHFKNIDTEMYYKYNWEIAENIFNEWYLNKINWFKTLSLEEAIAFLPKYIWQDKLIIEALWSGWQIKYNIEIRKADFKLLEAIEKLLIYLLDNELLVRPLLPKQN